jgi:hypothetical protein
LATFFLIIAALFGLLVILVAIPIDISFEIDRVEQMEGQLTVRWLFGLVRFTTPITATGKTEAASAPEYPETETPRKPHQAGRPLNVLGVLKQVTFRRRVYRLLRDLLRATHPHEMFLHLRLGLGDPADTGRLWAFVGPTAAYFANNIQSARIIVEPEFMDLVFEVHGHGRVYLIPLQFIALIIAFFLSPPSLRAWRTLRQGNN